MRRFVLILAIVLQPLQSAASSYSECSNECIDVLNFCNAAISSGYGPCKEICEDECGFIFPLDCAGSCERQCHGQYTDGMRQCSSEFRSCLKGCGSP
jgi:hypothetical protein